MLFLFYIAHLLQANSADSEITADSGRRGQRHGNGKRNHCAEPGDGRQPVGCHIECGRRTGRNGVDLFRVRAAQLECHGRLPVRDQPIC